MFTNTIRAIRFGRSGVMAAAPKGEYLTNQQLAEIAPTIFKEERHSSRSERFEVIPTFQLLDGLRNEGFVPVKVQVGGSKDEEKRNFTKHLIRFRRMSDLTGSLTRVGDSVAEVVMLNAHDGTSSYQLHAGLFRLVCTNGMTVSDGDFGFVRVGHAGKDIMSKVIEGTYSVIDDAQRAIGMSRQMQEISVNVEEQRVFGEAALALRFDEAEKPEVTGMQVIQARRAADVGSNLWLTFNRAQENLVRGGLRFTHRNPTTLRVQHRETRPVRSADGDIRLNRALWVLAKEFANLKGQPVTA